MKKIRKYLFYLNFLVLIFIITPKQTFAVPKAETIQEITDLKRKYLHVDNDIEGSLEERQKEKEKLKHDLRQLEIKIDHGKKPVVVHKGGVIIGTGEYVDYPEDEMNDFKREYNQKKARYDRLIVSLGESAKQISEKVAFSNFYNFFTNLFKYTFKYIKDVARFLLKIFGVLELLNLLINRPSDLPIQSIGKLLFKGIMLWVLLGMWEGLFCNNFLMDVKRMAYYVINKGADIPERAIGFDINGVFDYYGAPLKATLLSLSSLNPFNLGYTIVALIGLAITALITLEYLMALIEFYFMMATSMFLIPFCMWQHTQSLGTRVVGVIAYQFFKMFTIYFFLILGFNLLPEVGNVSFKALYGDLELSGISAILNYTVSLFIIKTLLTKCSAFANMLVGGGSALSSHDAMGAISRVTAAGITAAYVGVKGFKLGAKAHNKKDDDGAKRLKDAAKLNSKKENSE